DLHFQMMDGMDILRSEGLPYLIDSYDVQNPRRKLVISIVIAGLPPPIDVGQTCFRGAFDPTDARLSDCARRPALRRRNFRRAREGRRWRRGYRQVPVRRRAAFRGWCGTW